MTDTDIKNMQEMVQEWHKERLDFLHSIALKYGMNDSDICRLCSYLEVQRWELNQNVLETT